MEIITSHQKEIKGGNFKKKQVAILEVKSITEIKYSLKEAQQHI